MSFACLTLVRADRLLDPVRVFLIVVAILGLYVFAITGERARTGNNLAFLGLAIPLFTTFWCWRYAQIGRWLA